MWAHECVYTSTLIAQLSLLIQLVSHIFFCKKISFGTPSEQNCAHPTHDIASQALTQPAA